MYQQILLPLDGSELAELALGPARELALAFQARLHLLQVLSYSQDFDLVRGAEYGALSDDYIGKLLEEVAAAQTSKAEAYLAGMAAELEAAGVEVATGYEMGSPAEKILGYARAAEIDLIVMSTHGRGGLGRLLVGSVTDRVIRAGEQPVLVVPPESGRD